MSAFTYATNSPYVLKVIWKQLQLNSVQTKFTSGEKTTATFALQLQRSGGETKTSSRVQYYYFIWFIFSDHCVWWASHRLQKPHRSEQSHQSGKNPAVSLLARMIKPSCAHREIPSLYFQGDYTFKVLPPKHCLRCIFSEHSSQSFTFIS